jgi:hypothetical protein
MGVRGELVSDGRLMNNDKTGAATAAQNTDARIRRGMGVSSAD